MIYPSHYDGFEFYWGWSGLVMSLSSNAQRLMNVTTTVAATVLLGVLLAGCGDASDSLADDRAPHFVVPDASGQQVALSTLLEDQAGVVLVFYRGFF